MVKMNKCWFDKLEKLYIENVKVTIKDGVVTIKPYPEKDMERCYKELEEENKELKNTQKILEHNYQVALSETIHKLVIQDKIDELKHRKSKDEFEFACKLKGILYLQELLEERNNK